MSRYEIRVQVLAPLDWVEDSHLFPDGVAYTVWDTATGEPVRFRSFGTRDRAERCVKRLKERNQ